MVRWSSLGRKLDDHIHDGQEMVSELVDLKLFENSG
jgi:hypothetical protein